MNEKIEAGLGTVFGGGLLTAIGAVGSVSFGLLPAFLMGLGTIVIGVGFYEDFRKPTA